MRAHITYDSDGFSHMTVEADRISSQMFNDGRTLIKLLTADGVQTRALQFAKVYVIDTDMTAGGTG